MADSRLLLKSLYRSGGQHAQVEALRALGRDDHAVHRASAAVDLSIAAPLKLRTRAFDGAGHDRRECFALGVAQRTRWAEELGAGAGVLAVGNVFEESRNLRFGAALWLGVEVSVLDVAKESTRGLLHLAPGSRPPELHSNAHPG